MGEILIIALVVILVAPFLRGNKYQEIEHQQSMRRAMSKLQAKYRRYGL